jgi:hypothetical protein
MKKKVMKVVSTNEYISFLVIIKCESMLNTNEMENKSVNTSNNNVCVESGQNVVVRISRIDCNKG